MANIQDKSSIVDSTVFLRVSFGVFGNSKGVSSAVLKKANDTAITAASAKLLKIQKTLLESPELEAIKTADGKMRTRLYQLCLPYDMGVSLLPRVYLETVESDFEAFKAQRATLVDTFGDVYPERCAKAKAELQTLADELGVPFDMLYNSKDYPSVEGAKSKFYFDWSYYSFSVPESLKAAGLYEKSKEKELAKLQVVSDEITALMRESLLELVTHLKTALEPNEDGKPKRLFASAVTNVQEFLDTFKARNITNDSDLDALVSEVQKIIHPGLAVDTLKKDGSLKDQVHSSLEGFAAKLSTLVETVPGRKFRTE
jgi:hypothetical protein